MAKSILILMMVASLPGAFAQEEAAQPVPSPAAPSEASAKVEEPKVEAKAEVAAPATETVAKAEEPAKAAEPVTVPPVVVPPPVVSVPAPPAKVEVAAPVKVPAVPLMPSPEPDLAEQGIPGNPLPAPTAAAPVMRERLEHLGNSPTAEAPIDAEIAIILHNNRFYPSRLKLKEGQPTRLFFTSLNQKPAALIVQELQVQRWIAKETGSPPTVGSTGEISRELNQNKITEVSLQPKKGTYMFHDALSGAVGEILVE